MKNKNGKVIGFEKLNYLPINNDVINVSFEIISSLS
jgi:hypothetical protein